MMTHQKNLDNPSVLITGGATGIGKATALRLARDGFFVIINYKDNKSKNNINALESIFKKEKANFMFMKADISKKTELKQMIDQIRKKIGKLDILINNAAISKIQSISNFDLGEWDEIIGTNLTSAAVLTKSCLPLMKKAKNPRIIFLGSMGVFKGSAERLAYTVSKGGIAGLCKSLALELAPKILVNAVVPGYIDTDMLNKFRIESVGSQLKKILLRRYGKPEDVAGAIAFLCSKDASYITGQSIHVNGGAYFS